MANLPSLNCAWTATDFVWTSHNLKEGETNRFGDYSNGLFVPEDIFKHRSLTHDDKDDDDAKRRVLISVKWGF